MKQIKLGLIAIIALVSVLTIHAQTADDIINKFVNALGGKDKINSIKSMHRECVTQLQGVDINVSETIEHMVGLRMNIAMKGIQGYEIVTPEGGIQYFPFSGQKDTVVMTVSEVNKAAVALDIQDCLFNYKEKGNKVELLGTEKVDNAECYKLKVMLKNGEIKNFFIDNKSYYVVKKTEISDITDQAKEVTTNYSNYKKTDNGFIVPYTETNSESGVNNFSKIEINSL